MNHLLLSNRQKTRKIHTPLLRQIARHLLGPLLHQKNCRVAVHLVDGGEMARLNHDFLNHSGSTDVITFDYGCDEKDRGLRGEIFISIEDAIAHARRFRSSWQEETIRYLVHGALHLLQFDDQTPALRRVMKQNENRLLKALSAQFPLGELENHS